MLAPRSEREQLLLERACEGEHLAHSVLNTPTTLPRICTYGA